MTIDLSQPDLKNLAKTVHHNLTTPQLYEEILRRKEGNISHLGPMVVNTGKYTGRSPEDKFIVEEPSSAAEVWWGTVNKTFDEAHFDALEERIEAHLADSEVYVQDCYAGSDPDHRLTLRVVTDLAWHSLFARNMFIREPERERLAELVPDWDIIYTSAFKAEPERDHTRSEAYVLIHFGRRRILIGGTEYSG